MTYQERMKMGLEDELEKIAGELQGFTRIGRKPIGVERLLEREAESDVTPTDVAQESLPKTEEKDEKEKVSNDMKRRLGATMVTLGVGGAGALAAQRANQDRKLGRQMRIQNQM